MFSQPLQELYDNSFVIIVSILVPMAIDYAKHLNTTYAQFSVYTPYPGTPVFEEFSDKLDVKKYEDFDQYQLVYKHNKLSKKDVRVYLDRAYSSYYTRFFWLTKYLFSFIGTLYSSKIKNDVAKEIERIFKRDIFSFL